MGDHRFSVKISLTGIDGKTRNLDWWVNWHEDKPEKLYNAVLDLAEESGLPTKGFKIE